MIAVLPNLFLQIGAAELAEPALWGIAVLIMIGVGLIRSSRSRVIAQQLRRVQVRVLLLGSARRQGDAREGLRSSSCRSPLFRRNTEEGTKFGVAKRYLMPVTCAVRFDQ